jgi:hypothetical protein
MARVSECSSRAGVSVSVGVTRRRLHLRLETSPPLFFSLPDFQRGPFIAFSFFYYTHTPAKFTWSGIPIVREVVVDVAAPASEVGPSRS